MSDFPREGDNFTLRGPWRILTGNAWADWRKAALDAEIRAAETVGDTFTAARLRRRRETAEEVGLVGGFQIPR